MNASFPPVRTLNPFAELDALEEEDRGMPSDEERAAAFKRVRAMLAAIPPKPELTQAQLEEARQRADAAVRNLVRGHLAFGRSGL